jgi:tyrosine-protein phosphatase non-receptor type 1
VEVEEAGRSYILTQGPLQTTIGHFWLMIWDHKSTAVLMLNGLVERGAVKCHQYWPDLPGDVMQLDDVNLRVSLISEIEKEHYVVRKCLLTDDLSGESREVLQFHYTAWPDFGLPESPASFLEFLFAVRSSGSLDLSQSGPPVVHCSAGIGRSGTLCLVDSCLLLVSSLIHSVYLCMMMMTHVPPSP